MRFCNARAHYREQPRVPGPELPPSEIPEPETPTEIRSEMRSIDVQGQRGPCAPPFAGLHARSIDGADIKRIEPPQATRDRIPHEHENQRVHHAADNCKRKQLLWRRRRRRRSALQRVPRRGAS